MGAETYSEIPNEDKDSKSLIYRIKKHIAAHHDWWIIYLLAVIAVAISEMTILVKFVWIIGLILMAYWTPIIYDYLIRRSYQ